MSQPAATATDKVTGMCIHIILSPSPGGPVPTPTPHPFMGTIMGGVCATVLIGGKPAATMGSTATNLPPHIPIGAGPFAVPPTNQATIIKGSATVLFCSKPAARMGDTATLCSNGTPPGVGTVMGTAATVLIGG